MISKLAKARDNWFFKILSIGVAVSFISLFGVTGYIDTASQNQTVIKVGKNKITQSEFSHRHIRELNALKKFTGDDMEISDELKKSITDSLVKQMIDDSVIDLVMKDNKIYFPKAFLQQAIFSQPNFINPADGYFNKELFRQYLNAVNLTEDEYVDILKRAMAKKMIIDNLVEGIEVPKVLSDATHKMDNQRKIFKYITISPNDVKIERKMSNDEAKQYFEDFSETFIIPETRHAKVLFISNQDILNKYVLTDEALREYYEQNKAEFNQPEKRNVAQMVFLDKDSAEKALTELSHNNDFAAVAKNFKADNAENPSLGIVAQDELADDLAYTAFELPINKPELLQVADTWQIIKVTEIFEAKEANFEDAKQRITEILKDDEFYDALRDVRADIDDAVNAGKSLEEISSQFGVKVFDIKNVQENNLAQGFPDFAKSLGNTLDFNEILFSYGLDEISSAEEFDEGVAVIKLTSITDAHLPEMEDVLADIEKLWTIQEKNALAKEIAENIYDDINDGSDISEAAKARKLEVYRSEPINRNETFADLTNYEINDLFIANSDEVKSFEHSGNNFVIAVPFETVNYNDQLDDEGLRNIKKRIQYSLLADMQKQALQSYAEDYEINVDYQLIGLSE